MTTYETYQALIKPTWAPPSFIFGPVWTVLYVLIALSYGKVFLMAAGKELPLMVALPFALNLVFNFSFAWLQFGLKSNMLAAIDILLVLATLVWALVAVYPYVSWVSVLNIPYLLWVTFATVLQLTITYLNR